MATPNLSLTFKGNTEEAFNFYKSVFGGEFSSLMRWKDMPGSKFEGEDANRIMHIALPIGKNCVIMGGDPPKGMWDAINIGNNFNISIECDSKEEATKLYRGLVADGGKEHPQMPLGDSFWGSYFGMLTDKFAIQWMVNYQYPKK